MLLSPARRVLSECLPYIYPFGYCTAQNVIESFEFSAPYDDDGKFKV